MKPELLVNAHDTFELSLSVKCPSFEHVVSPPATDIFLIQNTVTVEDSGRNVKVPSADESWMDGLSAADVIRQYGIDPNFILTLAGEFETPSGEEFIPASLESSDFAYILDEGASGSHQSDQRTTDEKKLYETRS